MIETIKQNGVLRVGMSTFVPWAMRDKEGELIGFEIDVATELAKDMGVEVEFVPTAWDGIIPALLAGKFDVIIGGMTITPERNLTVNFTAPYAHSSLGVMANKELAEGLTWPDDYNSSGRHLRLPARRHALHLYQRELSEGDASPVRRSGADHSGGPERQRPCRHFLAAASGLHHLRQSRRPVRADRRRHRSGQ